MNFALNNFSNKKDMRLIENEDVETRNGKEENKNKNKNKNKNEIYENEVTDKTKSYDNNDSIKIETINKSKTNKNRKLKARKHKAVREGRTWNVQNMIICDGQNTSKVKNDFSLSSSTTTSTSYTTLPCVDVLAEVKAQGNKYMYTHLYTYVHLCLNYSIDDKEFPHC